jgi:DNA-binding transcriptional ArsR family regulator
VVRRTRSTDHAHGVRVVRLTAETTREGTASLFRTLGDPERLKLVEVLAVSEWCVSELAQAVASDPAVLSQRLRVLRQEGLVRRRREGRHIFYRLADANVADLVRNAFAHAKEGKERGD